MERGRLVLLLILVKALSSPPLNIISTRGLLYIEFILNGAQVVPSLF